jgi:hypothetical protein
MSGLEQHLVDALANRVVTTLRERGPGHCLQVPHVPQELADGACRAVAKEIKLPDSARVVSVAPKREWQATPEKIVELRNRAEEDGGRLALFIPAGVHLAAEDSFGRSTFEVIDVGDLYGIVIRELQLSLQTVAPDLADRAESITRIATGDSRFSVAGREAAAYLARLTAHPSEEELGAALVELGLLPDLQIGQEESSNLSARLARNLEQISALTELAPPADRIQRLSIPPDEPESEGLAEELRSALADGTVDRHELAHRFDGDGAGAPPVDFGPLLTGVAAGAPTELSIIELKGDFAEGDPPIIKKANASVKIRYRCRPPAVTISGLRELRLELLSASDRIDDLAEAGVESAKRGRSLPKKAEGVWTIKIPTDAASIEPGLHRLRLQAVNDDNLILKEALSSPFLIGEEVEEADVPITAVASVSAAKVEARAADERDRPPGPAGVGIAEAGRVPIDTYVVRFEGAPARFQLLIARSLSEVERYTLKDPRSLARYVLSLRTGGIEETVPPDEGMEPPDAFLSAREMLFDEIARGQYTVEGAHEGPIVALCDLRGLEGSIRRYLHEWADALATPDPQLLRTLLAIDQIELRHSDVGSGVLVGPTHPLRIAWLARYQSMLEDWADGEDHTPQETSEVRSLLATLAPANLPHVVVGRQGELRYLEPIDLYWGIWAPPHSSDVNALPAEVRARLHLAREPVGAINVSDLVARIRRYLAAHPYVDLLQINFVQPGDAAIVLRSLLALQDDPATADLRYVVRLFSTELSRSELGRALDEFMADPESSGARRDAADPFLASTDDPLTPKLTYSKHQASDLVSEPRRFPAHLTFFLDWFRLDAVPVQPLAERRSFFAHGLIVDPVTVYRPAEGDLNPQWDEHIVVPPSQDDELLVAADACARATARLLDREAVGAIPAVRLELDRVRRSILDAVHRTSDWVVVIDPIFGDEYLDSAPTPEETPRYLIDASDPAAPGFGRRIVVSTRSREELGMLLAPVAAKYGLEVPEDRIEILLDALRALSPGLPLRLLNNRTRALEAFSLALASLYLAAQGVLRRALAVPLDVHQDLFREPNTADLRRTDLAVIRLDGEARRIAVSLVEVKARGQLAEETPAELVEQISGQLENSRLVLRRRLFAVDLRDRANPFAGSLMLRRLIRLLDRYLERAIRYGLLDVEQAPALRAFVASLDRGYSIAFDKHALIFDLEGASRAPERVADVRVIRIGRDEIGDVLARTQTPVGTHVIESGGTEVVETLLGPSDREPDGGAESVPGIDGELMAHAASEEDAEHERVDETPDEADTGEAPVSESGPRREDVVLIGATSDSRQYGIIGQIAGTGRDVAFDVDGTNVVSIFGVQGSGKSYSVGNLIEAAAIRRTDLNRLPHPLATIVFHYSTDQTYVPEYASMYRVNDDPRDIATLAEEYGARPVPLEDIRVLVPPGLQAERQADYPDLAVNELVLAPSELSVNDWRLLMGVEGGDQLYVKAMGTVFRSLRRNLTLQSLKRELDTNHALSQSQKSLARARIEFVEAFVSDGTGVSELVHPGGLLLVDVRDPWIERENALALFMVMLRLCAQVRTPAGRSFNKLIVFDEAHKYMTSSGLTGAIVETVREMRHRATTVVIASQDPPSLPKGVIELSTVVFAHRFTSPKWLQHVAQVNEAFSRRLSPAQLATLKPGEAFVWSRDGAEFRVPQRLRMRPRLTRHGGGTRRAAG